jgi:hypothetical protein
MKLKYLPIVIFFVSCTDMSENKLLKEKLSHQQATIDSLTKEKTSIRQPGIFVDTSVVEKAVSENKKNTETTGWAIEDLPEIYHDQNGKMKFLCPVKILEASKEYDESFSAIGTMKLQNNYPKTTSALELDFGSSKRRISCKIPARGTLVVKLKLSEKEANDFLSIYTKEGDNIGLHFDRVIFSNGRLWEGNNHE